MPAIIKKRVSFALQHINHLHSQQSATNSRSNNIFISTEASTTTKSSLSSPDNSIKNSKKGEGRSHFCGCSGQPICCLGRINQNQTHSQNISSTSTMDDSNHQNRLPPPLPSLNGDTDHLHHHLHNHPQSSPGLCSWFSDLSRELVSSSELLFHNKLNWLLLLGPVALLGDATGWLGEPICFAFSGIALIPCAER
jgi:hypothetical protein